MPEPTASAHLPPTEKTKLAALLARAEADAGNAEAEQIAALGAIGRMLARHGLRLRDLPMLAPEPHREPLMSTWRKACVALAERPGALKPWERRFVGDLPSFKRLSSRQRYVLDEIVSRVLGEGWQP